jgi:hypothetical protein
MENDLIVGLSYQNEHLEYVKRLTEKNNQFDTCYVDVIVEPLKMWLIEI